MCESSNCTCELSLAGFPHAGAHFTENVKMAKPGTALP